MWGYLGLKGEQFQNINKGKMKSLNSEKMKPPTVLGHECKTHSLRQRQCSTNPKSKMDKIFGDSYIVWL